MYSDDFGCILTPCRAAWPTGLIEPLAKYDEVRAAIEKQSHPDGHRYPPTVHTVREHRDGSTTPVPGTDRHAFLWPIPATHRVMLHHEPPGDVTRRGLGGFVIHFAGFLNGYRTQFAEWQIDGRLPTKRESDLVLIRESEMDTCVEKAVESWMSWSDASKRAMGNALYFHTRSPMYEWDWERFQAEYQVMDAFYSVARRELNTPTVRHCDRLGTLCGLFGIATDPPMFRALAKRRNALVHEVVWGEGMPGEGFIEGYRMGQALRHINQRLGLAILGISCRYVRSSWAALQSHSLGLYP